MKGDLKEVKGDVKSLWWARQTEMCQRKAIAEKICQDRGKNQ